jgi:DNA-binding PadR family transcriptional regulator
MNISLSQAEFYILLSLALKERHGYEIMKQVEHDSQGKVLLGPGTLYGAVKRLLQAHFIEEIPGDHPRRRYYRMTEEGRKALSHELERYQDALALARRAGLMPGLSGLESAV